MKGKPMSLHFKIKLCQPLMGHFVYIACFLCCNIIVLAADIWEIVFMY